MASPEQNETTKTSSLFANIEEVNTIPAAHFSVNFECISHITLVLSLLTLNE